jgi:hypothetical protein
MINVVNGGNEGDRSFVSLLRMKKMLLLAAILVGAASASQAGGIGFNIGFGFPLPTPPGLVISRPVPVVVAPRVVVTPPVCESRVVVTPPVCEPRVVVTPPVCESRVVITPSVYESRVVANNGCDTDRYSQTYKKGYAPQRYAYRNDWRDQRHVAYDRGYNRDAHRR